MADKISPELSYFSFLRPLSEIAIARRFARHEAYHGVFRSCNTAFRQDEAARGKRWCCDCPKCRFVFLALAPFVGKEKMVRIFGKNMLDDAGQTDGFSALCGVSAYKPFECVGEIDESAAALSALASSAEWKDDAVVKALGSKVPDARLEDFLWLHKGHAVPRAYQGLLIENPQRIVVWGTGKEGRAAAAFAAGIYPAATIAFVDENPCDDPQVVTEPNAMTALLLSADMLIKSPGVSLYHPLVRQATQKGVFVTSLLNLWMQRRPLGKSICITGTKGKSTTSSLLGHVLNRLGYKAAVLGNIGVPVSEAPEGMDYYVLEMSSYQAADFAGPCDIAAVTSLYPEHLNWHGTLERYYADKLNVLASAACRIVHPQVGEAYEKLPGDCRIALIPAAESVPNAYLKRAHNLSNVGVVLAVCNVLGIAPEQALSVMGDFKGLSHRQQEIGEGGGVLFVDDSIATTPQAAIAAMDVYRQQPVVLIAGGFDRGIDYQPLVDYVEANKVRGVVCLGPCGERILQSLKAAGYERAASAPDMQQAVKSAVRMLDQGGVVLLSPAAPSFGMFKDYIERGQVFAAAAQNYIDGKAAA